jgi:hypothetical protein
MAKQLLSHNVADNSMILKEFPWNCNNALSSVLLLQYNIFCTAYASSAILRPNTFWLKITGQFYVTVNNINILWPSCRTPNISAKF